MLSFGRARCKIQKHTHSIIVGTHGKATSRCAGSARPLKMGHHHPRQQQCEGEHISINLGESLLALVTISRLCIVMMLQLVVTTAYVTLQPCLIR